MQHRDDTHRTFTQVIVFVRYTTDAAFADAAQQRTRWWRATRLQDAR